MLQKIFFFFIICFAFACTKESTSLVDVNDPNPVIADEPSIELLSISSNTVKASQDSISFIIEYIDGNGDLGTTDPDETSIELVDQRDAQTLVFRYHLQPLAPDGSEITITGELNIVLDHTILLDENNDSETTTFTIRIKDRAGNWSNRVETENITINK